ncbi:unnamed protein product [Protopolystoma xenopodis]|uniref:Uncharacterized protein n=1 Tax=Protopolystoma xenopodis TaxID=117903 RepID=A0A448XQ48_9PLAT|nr:unnamed protein product [Protopolystoma xenopodis]
MRLLCRRRTTRASLDDLRRNEASSQQIGQSTYQSLRMDTSSMVGKESSTATVSESRGISGMDTVNRSDDADL